MNDEILCIVNRGKPKEIIFDEENTIDLVPTKKEMDEEDEMTSDCFMLLCYANDGRIFTDRVYLSPELAQKRIEYLNKISDGRGVWRFIYSQLGK